MLFTAEDVFHIAKSKGYGYLYQDLEDKGPCRQVGEAPWPSLYVCLAEASGAMQQARKAASPANQRKQVFFFCSLVAASLVAASLVKKESKYTQTHKRAHTYTYTHTCGSHVKKRAPPKTRYRAMKVRLHKPPQTHVKLYPSARVEGE